MIGVRETTIVQVHEKAEMEGKTGNVHVCIITSRTSELCDSELKWVKKKSESVIKALA